MIVHSTGSFDSVEDPVAHTELGVAPGGEVTAWDGPERTTARLSQEDRIGAAAALLHGLDAHVVLGRLPAVRREGGLWVAGDEMAPVGETPGRVAAPALAYLAMGDAAHAHLSAATIPVPVVVEPDRARHRAGAA